MSSCYSSGVWLVTRQPSASHFKSHSYQKERPAEFTASHNGPLPTFIEIHCISGFRECWPVHLSSHHSLHLMTKIHAYWLLLQACKELAKSGTRWRMAS